MWVFFAYYLALTFVKFLSILGSQPFQCLYCSECFQFPGALQHHVAANHFNETENTFGCELCGELFTSQTLLETHYENDHPNIVLEETDTGNAQVVQVCYDFVLLEICTWQSSFTSGFFC